MDRRRWGAGGAVESLINGARFTRPV